MRLAARAMWCGGVAITVVALATCASLAYAMAADAPLSGVREAANSAVADAPVDSDTYDIHIVVSGVEGMAAFDATVLYSTDALTPTAVTVGPFVPDGSTTLGPDYSDPGRVSFGAYNAQGEVASGAGVVATVYFGVVGLGSPGLALDHDLTAAYDSDGTRLDATFGIEFAPYALHVPAAFKGSRGGAHEPGTEAAPGAVSATPPPSATFTPTDPGSTTATSSPPARSPTPSQTAAHQPGLTFYVATDGDDATGDGSVERPFGTIGHAVNRGVPAEGGSTVIVRDGEYTGTSTITRGFPVTVTVRSEHPYGARLGNVEGGREAIRVYVRGPARLRVEGFVLSNHHPSHTCDGREQMYLVHFQDASNVVLHDNVVFGNNAPGTCNELLKINRGDAAYFPREIIVSGNVFYMPANAGGADIIDSVRPGEVDIVDNIFFSHPERDQSQSFITLKRQAPSDDSRSPRYRIRRNVFLSWGGKPDQAFIQFGEDGTLEHEITDALIENNLFIGDSPARLAAPIQLKGTYGVRVRANTVTGDLPGGAFGFRIGTEGDNPEVGAIEIRNNLWSDPTGTMGSRLVNAYGRVNLPSVVLDNNLYWNGGDALPTGGDVPIGSDARRVVADPLLSSDHSSVVLPSLDPGTGAFLGGGRTIRDEFLRLVEEYGAVPADSPAVGAADASDMPADDIRGLPRDARPDIGAYEQGAERDAVRDVARGAD